MKKVIMTASVPSMIGQFNMNNLQILQELGYEVHVACNFYDVSVWTQERIRQFKKELKTKKIRYHQIGFPRSPLDIRGVFHSFRQLKRLAEKERFNLMHCHTPVASVISRVVAHEKKIRVIYTAHGFHFYKGAPVKNWLVYYPIEKFFSRWTDVLITINREDYKRAKKKFYAKKTVYVPGVGIDLKKFGDKGKESCRKALGISADVTVLLSVGELNKNKNHEIVIKAMKNLPDNIIYVITGKGPLKEYLMKLAEKEKVASRVRLTGFRNNVTDFYTAADVYILPSIREGLNVSLMEAMASGLPCLVGKIRGNVDLIDEGKGGYLFNQRCVLSVNKNIRKIIRMNDNAGKYNRRKIAGFDTEKVRKIMTDIYDDIRTI